MGWDGANDEGEDGNRKENKWAWKEEMEKKEKKENAGGIRWCHRVTLLGLRSPRCLYGLLGLFSVLGCQIFVYGVFTVGFFEEIRLMGRERGGERYLVGRSGWFC